MYEYFESEYKIDRSTGTYLVKRALVFVHTMVLVIVDYMLVVESLFVYNILTCFLLVIVGDTSRNITVFVGATAKLNCTILTNLSTAMRILNETQVLLFYFPS